MIRCPSCGSELSISITAARPAEPEPASNGSSNDPVAELRQLLGSIVDDRVEDSRAAAFVSQMRGRLQEFGDRSLVTGRQLTWLGDIAEAQRQPDWIDR